MYVYMSVYVYDDDQPSLESVLKQSNRTKQDQRTYIASDSMLCTKSNGGMTVGGGLVCNR